MMGIATQPNFAASPYVYLGFVYEPPEAAGHDRSGGRVSRLIRVSADPNNYDVAVPGSEVVVIGNNSTFANIGNPDRGDKKPYSCQDAAGTPVRDCVPEEGTAHQISSAMAKHRTWLVRPRPAKARQLVWGPSGGGVWAAGVGAIWNCVAARPGAVRCMRRNALACRERCARRHRRMDHPGRRGPWALQWRSLMPPEPAAMSVLKLPLAVLATALGLGACAQLPDAAQSAR